MKRQDRNTIRDLMGQGPAASFPYGVWTTATGRQVIYDRRYRPVWQRDSATGPARPADPGEWVAGIVERRWFYDGCVAFADRPALFTPELEAWGIPA